MTQNRGKLEAVKNTQKTGSRILMLNISAQTKAKLWALILTVPLAMALLACGTDTNPTAQYSNLLKGARPLQAETAPKQRHEQNALWVSIKDDSGHPVKVLKFYAGKQVQYTVSAALFINVPFTLNPPQGLPPGVTFAMTSPGVFTIAGVPSPAPCETNATAATVIFSFSLVNKVDAATQSLLDSRNDTVEVAYVLNEEGARPTIVSQDLEQKKVNEGESLDFHVVVHAPRGDQAHLPTLTLFPEGGAGNEVHKVPGSKYIVSQDPDGFPQDMGGGNYKFSYHFSPVAIPWQGPAETSLTARTLLRAEDSCTYQVSETKIVDATVARPGQTQTAISSTGAAANSQPSKPKVKAKIKVKTKPKPKAPPQSTDPNSAQGEQK